jgi:hypothetical protein
MTGFDGGEPPLVDPLAARFVDRQLREAHAPSAEPTEQGPRSGPHEQLPLENSSLWPTSMIWLIGLLGFGLPSVCMRPSFSTVVRFGLLIVSLPTAFILFGPCWAEVIFVGTRYSGLGIYPFIATCILIPFLSVWLGFRDRHRLQAELKTLPERQ